MKLFFHPASPNARAVLVTAAMLDLPLQHCLIDVAADAHLQPSYLELNPNGKFPTLVDGDFVLWETIAITHYLASQRPESEIFPALDRRCRADVLRWQSWNVEHWAPVLKVFIFQNMFKQWKGLGAPDTDVIRDNEPNYNRFAAILDTRLAGRTYLVGSGLTLADVSVSSYLMYAVQARIPLDAYQNVQRWLDRIQAEPSWQATQPVF